MTILVLNLVHKPNPNTIEYEGLVNSFRKTIIVLPTLKIIDTPMIRTKSTMLAIIASKDILYPTKKKKNGPINIIRNLKFPSTFQQFFRGKYIGR